MVVTPLPAAASNVTGNSLDLGSVNDFAVNEKFAVQVSIPATPSLANATTVTLQLVDSADNVTFTAIAGVAPLVVTGGGSIGGPASSLVYGFAGSVRRYLALNAAVLVGAGNNTAVSSTFQLLF